MADAQSLSLAFIRAHPSHAARVLESMPAPDTAALFARLPARLTADVLAAMLPTAAARALGPLDDERAMELLGALGVQPTVAVLRQVAEPRRTRLIAGLPAAAAFAARALLGHDEDTVGAWTDPDVVALTPETRVREALERVRSTQGFADTIFVVDGEQVLIGEITAAALLRAADSALLGAVGARPEAVLTVHAPLASALAHPGWRACSALPVVQQGARLVGVLTRSTLVLAHDRRSGASSDQLVDSLGGILASRYWEAFSGLLQAAVSLLPAVTPVDSSQRGTYGER